MVRHQKRWTNSLYQGSTASTREDDEEAIQAVFNETRPRFELLVNGRVVDFLYDTGAITTCISKEEYQRQFHGQMIQPREGSLSGASDVDLRLQGFFPAHIQYQGQDFIHPINVCGQVGDNLMGIDLINKLGLLYRASTNSLFVITMDEEGWLVTRQETTFKPQSVTILNLRTPGGKVKPDKEERIIVQVEHWSFPNLTGGPALATRRTNGHCVVAITNVAPY
jgi:hypothetical protein